MSVVVKDVAGFQLPKFLSNLLLSPREKVDGDLIPRGRHGGHRRRRSSVHFVILVGAVARRRRDGEEDHEVTQGSDMGEFVSPGARHCRADLLHDVLLSGSKATVIVVLADDLLDELQVVCRLGNLDASLLEGGFEPRGPQTVNHNVPGRNHADLRAGHGGLYDHMELPVDVVG